MPICTAATQQEPARMRSRLAGLPAHAWAWASPPDSTAPASSSMTTPVTVVADKPSRRASSARDRWACLLEARSLIAPVEEYIDGGDRLAAGGDAMSPGAASGAGRLVLGSWFAAGRAWRRRGRVRTGATSARCLDGATQIDHQ